MPRPSASTPQCKHTATEVAAAPPTQMAIEHMVLIEKPRHFDTKTFKANFTPRIESYSNVITAKDLSIGYDTVLSTLSFRLMKGERLAIIGENGKGKSTLLKTLVGLLPPLGGEFTFGQNVEWGYFDQQKAVVNDADPEQSVLDNFWECYPDMLREQVRSALGSFLFSGEEVEKKMGQLSGGEKVRLALCKMFQTKPNLLILDEPTNHMDMAGKEALEKMLVNYGGTVLFVSHDRYFIQQIATGILEFGKEEIRQYPLDYSSYLEKKAAADAEEAAMEAAKKQAAKAAPTLEDVFDKKTYYNPGKIRSRLEKQLEKYNRQLEESEQKCQELQLQLVDPALSTDFEKLMDIQKQLDEEEKNQESLLERILETETELEYS